MVDAHNFRISEGAEIMIKKLLSSEPEGSKLRIQVLGGGCSGFQYKYDFDGKFNEDDIFICDDIVVIDQLSISFVAGSLLDYKEDLGSAGFIIKNPNATAKCGCGNSFSI